MAQSPDTSQRALERWGWTSIVLNIALSTLNFGMAYAASSLAIAAEMVHNIVDLAASVTVLVGLKLSWRTSRTFPYGLHKVENLVAAAVAILIFVAAYELGREATTGSQRELTLSSWILGGVALSAVLPLLFGTLEGRAARRANSPSLGADAKEFRVHVLTSGVVLVALTGHMVGINFPLERVAAVVVALVVVKTGWELLSDAMRVLLDASLDQETLARARKIIEGAPAVIRVRSVVGHNAGRFRFLEAVADVRVQDLQRADVVARGLERTLCQQIPFLERALVEVRPARRDVVRVALPLDRDRQGLCAHFGTAEHFLLADNSRKSGEVTGRNVVKNPFADGPKGRGLQVAHWLLEQEVDMLVTRDDLSGKGPGHALGEAGIPVILTTTREVDAALAEAMAEATPEPQDESSVEPSLTPPK